MDFLNIEDNTAWKDRWEAVVSKDYDYDSDFLIRLITHKLELMYKYFRVFENFKTVPLKDKIVDFEEHDIKDICDTIQYCYNLGIKILTHNYGEKADKIFEECGNITWLVETSEEEDYCKWYKLTLKAEADRKRDIKKFFNKIGETITEWWV